MLALCPGCGGQFDARADARYCSAACRQRAYRKRAAQQNKPLREWFGQDPAELHRDTVAARAARARAHSRELRSAGAALRRTLGVNRQQMVRQLHDIAAQHADHDYSAIRSSAIRVSVR